MKIMMTVLGSMLISSTILSSPTLAAEVVKTCNFTVTRPGMRVVIPTTFRVIQDDAKLIGKGTQIKNDSVIVLPDQTVTIEEFSVRWPMTEDSAHLNLAEKLIRETDRGLKNQETGSAVSVGVDLGLIRTAKVYLIENYPARDGWVIIEAKDESGKEIGSFVTGSIDGIFIFACE